MNEIAKVEIPDPQRMEKVYRDGNVAVLYSPGFGAGWHTWNTDTEGGERLLFCPRLVYAVLGESGEDPLSVAQQEFPQAYHGGIRDIEVAWVPEGSRFEIHEYDGAESIRLLTPDDGFTA